MRFLLLLLAGLLAAQSRDLRVKPVSEADRVAFERSRKIALVVGVGEYPTYGGIGRLAYPTADATAIGDQLQAQGYTVIRLLDSQAVRAAIRGALRNIREVLDQQDGTLVFFFAGHGWAPADKRNFLATFDADASDLGNSGMALDEVLQLMQATGARRRVAWIDACRNEPGRSVTSSRVMAALDKAEGTRVLLSTRAGKLSYEDKDLKQGVFSYFLARALKGEAARGDGLMTFRDVADYVIENVQQYGLTRGDLQIPYEAGEASGDFLIGRGGVAPALTPAPVPVVPPSPAATVSREAKAGDARVDPKDGLKYLWIPAGTFRMGCSEGDGDCYDNEKPAREVTVNKGFWMSQTEVTVEAYRKLVAATPGNASMPVVNVDWNGARSFCTFAGGRLPTEAEWEYAARGGSREARPGSPDQVGWFKDNAGAALHGVGLKEANGFGLFDMLGNVWEWTADSYGETGSDRVLRGGSFDSEARFLRVSFRNWYAPANRVNNVGFRCVLEN